MSTEAFPVDKGLLLHLGFKIHATSRTLRFVPVLLQACAYSMESYQRLHSANIHVACISPVVTRLSSSSRLLRFPVLMLDRCVYGYVPKDVPFTCDATAANSGLWVGDIQCSRTFAVCTPLLASGVL